MSTKSRQSIYGGAIIGAKIRAKNAREAAVKALRDADRAEAEAWSIRMEGYGGPAQPSPTIGQCLNGGLGWLEVECLQDAGEPAARCHPPPQKHSALEARGFAEMPLVPQGTPCAAGTHDQADGIARDHALHLGTS
jgi:hypothetical protein